MRLIWKFNLVVATVAFSLIAADFLLDRMELLGSNCSSDRIKGSRIDALFDGQPVIPDRIDVFPLDEMVNLFYKSDGYFWHCYPTVTIVTEGDVISLCLIESNEGRHDCASTASKAQRSNGDRPDCHSTLPQVRQAKLGRTNSGRSYIVKKSTYD